MNEQDLVAQAIKKNRSAQSALYKLHNNVWFSICLRYVAEFNDASDVLQNALVKIFTKLDLFDSNKGTFKSWTNKIIVNECLMFLRKKTNSFHVTVEEMNDQLVDESETPYEKLTGKELTKLISSLPLGYRTVFNLYVLDGFNHREIAEQLQISEGTSKSQLSKARKYLQQKLEVMI